MKVECYWSSQMWVRRICEESGGWTWVLQGERAGAVGSPQSSHHHHLSLEQVPWTSLPDCVPEVPLLWRCRCGL